MKKTIFALAALPAVLALGACGEAATDEATTDDMATDTTMEAPVDGTMAGDTATDGTMADDDGMSMTASEDGVTADVNDGDTSVSADISDDPSATVETN